MTERDWKWWIYLTIVFVLLTALGLGACCAYGAEPTKKIWADCEAEFEQNCNYANCKGDWPKLAQCVLDRSEIQYSDWSFDAYVADINRQRRENWRCNICDDPAGALVKRFTAK